MQPQHGIDLSNAKAVQFPAFNSAVSGSAAANARNCSMVPAPGATMNGSNSAPFCGHPSSGVAVAAENAYASSAADCRNNRPSSAPAAVHAGHSLGQQASMQHPTGPSGWGMQRHTNHSATTPQTQQNVMAQPAFRHHTSTPGIQGQVWTHQQRSSAQCMMNANWQQSAGPQQRDSSSASSGGQLRQSLPHGVTGPASSAQQQKQQSQGMQQQGGNFQTSQGGISCVPVQQSSGHAAAFQHAQMQQCNAQPVSAMNPNRTAMPNGGRQPSAHMPSNASVSSAQTQQPVQPQHNAATVPNRQSTEFASSPNLALHAHSAGTPSGNVTIGSQNGVVVSGFNHSGQGNCAPVQTSCTPPGSGNQQNSQHAAHALCMQPQLASTYGASHQVHPSGAVRPSTCCSTGLNTANHQLQQQTHLPYSQLQPHMQQQQQHQCGQPAVNCAHQNSSQSMQQMQQQQHNSQAQMLNAQNASQTFQHRQVNASSSQQGLQAQSSGPKAQQPSASVVAPSTGHQQPTSQSVTTPQPCVHSNGMPCAANGHAAHLSQQMHQTAVSSSSIQTRPNMAPANFISQQPGACSPAAGTHNQSIQPASSSIRPSNPQPQASRPITQHQPRPIMNAAHAQPEHTSACHTQQQNVQPLRQMQGQCLAQQVQQQQQQLQQRQQQQPQLQQQQQMQHQQQYQQQMHQQQQPHVQQQTHQHQQSFQHQQQAQAQQQHRPHVQHPQYKQQQRPHLQQHQPQQQHQQHLQHPQQVHQLQHPQYQAQQLQQQQHQRPQLVTGSQPRERQQLQRSMQASPMVHSMPDVPAQQQFQGQAAGGMINTTSQNMAPGQKQVAVRSARPAAGGNGVLHATSWTPQQQAQNRAAYPTPSVVASIKPGIQGKICLHLPNPNPKLAKHLTTKHPFLHPVGSTISPTNFAFEVQHLSTVLEIDSCSEAGVNLTLEEMPNLPKRLLLTGGSLPDETERFESLPEKLQKTLHAFQVDGVKFALKHGGRVLLGDEMGLGKTIQALAVAQSFRDEWPVLIISPVSLKDNWAAEAHQWLGVIDKDTAVVSNPSELERAHANNVPMVIANYELLSKSDYAPGKLSGGKHLNFKVLICDECHRIKNHKAQCTKNILPLLYKAKRAVLISGTPAMSKPCELMPQLRGLLPGYKFSNTEFADRYCAGDRFDALKGSRNLEELYMVLVNTVMIRRLKSDALKQLPPKLRNTVTLKVQNPEDIERLQELNKATQGISRVLNAAMTTALKGSAQAVDMFASVGKDTQQQVMKAFTDCAEIKVNLVIDHVCSKLDSQIDKFLVFAHHKNVLDAVERACNQKGAEYIRIDGQLATNKRQQLVNKFQDETSCRVAILSIKAAGVGLTLTAASHVIFAELYWIPGDLEQAEDRVHRIGQACTVVCDYLLLSDSVEERIWEMLKRKLQDTGTMLNGVKGKLQVNSTFQDGGNAGNNSAAVRSAVNAAAYSKRKACNQPVDPENKVARQKAGSSGQFLSKARNSVAQQNVSPNEPILIDDCGKVGEQRKISNFFTKDK